MLLKKDNFLFSILIFALLLFTHGCTTKTTVPATVSALPSISDPASYIEKASGLYIDNSSITGIIRLRINSPDQRITTKAAVSAKYPFFIRFEALNLFNNPVMLYVSDGENISVFFHQENELFNGIFSDNITYMLFGIPLSLSEFSNILMGHLPPFKPDESVITVLQNGDNYLFKVVCPDNTTAFFIIFDPENMNPLKYEKYIYGDKVLEVLFKNYQQYQERWFPNDIHIILPHPNIKMSITYQSANFDPIPDKYFLFTPPTGAKVFPLEDLLYDRQQE